MLAPIVPNDSIQESTLLLLLRFHVPIFVHTGIPSTFIDFGCYATIPRIRLTTQCNIYIAQPLFLTKEHAHRFLVI